MTRSTSLFLAVSFAVVAVAWWILVAVGQRGSLDFLLAGSATAAAAGFAVEYLRTREG